MEFAVRHGQGIANPIAGEYDNYALIEFSRSRPDSGMRADMETMLEQAFEEGLIQDATVAQSDAQRAAFWLIRETVVEAQKPEGGSIKHDVSVPVSRVPEFIRAANAAVEALIPGRSEEHTSELPSLMSISYA